MATSETWVQDVITCDLCVKPTQKYCNCCQVRLCKDCVRKHREEFNSLSHEIVSFLDRKVQLAFPECQEHPGQRCEAHCKQCVTPVCIKCFLDPHKGHDAEELIKTHERRVQKIKRDTQEMKDQIIPNYQTENDNIEITISQINANRKDLYTENKKQRLIWHKEVDDIFDKIDSLSQSQTDRNLDVLKAYQNKLKSLISTLSETVNQNKKILKANKFAQVSSYQSRVQELRKLPEKSDIVMPSLSWNTVQGKELLIGIGDFTAELTQTSSPSLTAGVYRLTTGLRELLDEAKVVVVISTNYKPLFSLACVGETEAWIRGNKNFITHVDINGSIIGRIVVRFQRWPNDITVTRDGKVIYSDRDSRKVNMVGRNGKNFVIQTPITTPPNWLPQKLCCLKSGDILVHVMGLIFSEKPKHKILRYQEQKKTQEINEDTLGNPIFMDGYRSLYMSENNNGDLCVSDANAKTVVGLDSKGRIRFRYDGTLASRKKPVDPGYIVTDCLNQIIFTDYNNACLHILDKNGHFLKCVDNCGLKKALGLSVDSKGRLWVGVGDSGKIKVVQYMK